MGSRTTERFCLLSPCPHTLQCRPLFVFKYQRCVFSSVTVSSSADAVRKAAIHCSISGLESQRSLTLVAGALTSNPLSGFRSLSSATLEPATGTSTWSAEVASFA